MYQEYSIDYTSKNHYDQEVNDAYWQFLIIPEENPSQKLGYREFSNSLHDVNQTSINGFGFKTIRVHPRKKFKDISFRASFKVLKKEVNPFGFSTSPNPETDFIQLQDLGFHVDFEPFLKTTTLTKLPGHSANLFPFDTTRSIFENVQDLNTWVFKYLQFRTGVTQVSTTLKRILGKRQGVCQDFTHLFCGLAKKNGIPARYVSGYLHQGHGYFGDSQMHAWAEVYIPNIGWMGFDPTNNLLANSDYIKVCHGKDYTDCAPLKGVVYGHGDNTTSYSVRVQGQQQQ